MRPIMGAMVGPNIGLAKFGNLIIRKVADEADVGHVSKSTEETIAKIEDYNKNRDKLNANNEKIIIGSMDVEKWFPSMKAQPSAKGIRTMVEESEIDFKGFDFDIVGKYLGEYLTKQEIIEEGMEDIVYTKKEKAKRKVSKKKKKSVKNVSRKHVKKMHKKTMNIKHGEGKVNKREKENTELRRNQDDLTLVTDEVKGITAHKNEMSFHESINHIDCHVTLVNDEEKGISAHKNEMSNQDNINHKYGNVTIVSNEYLGKTTHKNGVRNHDNIKHNDGNVTIVSDEGNQITTHKNEVRNHDNIKHKDGNVTIVSDEGNQITTHKNEVRKQDNIKHYDGNENIEGSEEKGETTLLFD